MHVSFFFILYTILCWLFLRLISIWTNQCVLKEGGYTKGVQYKFLPYEELTTCNFDNTSMLCILVGYNRKDLSIQWVAADCVEDKPKAKICCLVSQSRSTGKHDACIIP